VAEPGGLCRGGSPALKKIYGKPLPGEVVDVDVEPAKPALPEVNHD
jgi:hypothetical protein